MSFAQQAKDKIAGRLRELKGDAVFRPDRPGYVIAPEDNLIEGVKVADFAEDLWHGSGNEMQDYTRKGVLMPAKFCASYSSSALAVNAFAPLKHAPTELRVAGVAGFTESLGFERKCPNGLTEENGRPAVPPNLDLLVEKSDPVLAIESKLIEPLCHKDQTFSSKYEAPFRGRDGGLGEAEPEWVALYESVVAMKKIAKEKRRFRRLDAAQLIKHYLGLHVTHRAKPVMLVYLFWEPANAIELEPFQRHRLEISDFSEALRRGSSHVRFKALSYRELWEEWESRSGWERMELHLSRLRARYDLEL